MEASEIRMPIIKAVKLNTIGMSIIGKLKSWWKGRNWKLEEDWCYTLKDNRTIVIKKGFVFDVASVPRLFWFLISPVGFLFIPGLLHDCGFRKGYLLLKDETDFIEMKKKEWDKLFLVESLRLNNFLILSMLAYLLLFCFSWYAWIKNEKMRKEALKEIKDILGHNPI